MTGEISHNKTKNECVNTVGYKYNIQEIIFLIFAQLSKLGQVLFPDGTGVLYLRSKQKSDKRDNYIPAYSIDY